MASTYVNDLRLNEMGTGDESGNWGVVTNLNLELIGEALSFGTEAITTNADTHTTTVADGAAGPGRAMYLKYTGTLDSACTITIAPNTISRMHFIENGTSGSQNIIISQGSGANVTIPAGDTKAVYLDGAGSGAAVVDAFASLSTVDLKVQDDLTVTDDATIGGTLGVTGVVTANAGVVVDNITIDGTEIDLSSGDLTLDVAGDIVLDADGEQVKFSHAGTEIGQVDMGSNNFTLRSKVSDADFAIHGNDGGSNIAALTLDMSAAGSATFNSSVTATGGAFTKASSGASATAGTVLTVEDDDNTELSLLGGSSSVLAINFGHSGDNDDGIIQYNTTSGAEGFYFQVNGGTEGLRIASTNTVVNEGGADRDFRVESNNNSKMIVVDGENDRLGVGLDPSYRFHVEDANANDNKTIAHFIGTAAAGTSTNDGGQFLSVSRNGPISQANGVMGGICFNGPSANGSNARIQGNYKFNSGRDLQFLTSSDNSSAPSERMVIKGAGMVAIGTTSTGNRSLSILQLNSGESGLYVNNSGGTITSSTAPLAQFQFSGDADVGDGTKVMEFQRQNDTIGSITMTGANCAYNTSSDRNLKENIVDASSQLNIIKNLQVREFDWKTNSRHDVGLIAQELHEHIPNVVTVGSDKKDKRGFTTPWSVDYGKLTPYLIKAVQELDARITTLEG